MRGKDKHRTKLSRSLRRRATQAELLLWRYLRDRQLADFKFVRQEPIDRYFVDFICRERKLIVEVDGGQHAESHADRDRDAVLKALGYRIVRIWNNDVLSNMDGVLQMLRSELDQPLTPTLSPQAGRGGRLESNSMAPAAESSPSVLGIDRPASRYLSG
ncbi:MAG: endonuclease domain-containing protein [Stellaceae bacterium]